MEYETIFMRYELSPSCHLIVDTHYWINLDVLVTSVGEMLFNNPSVFGAIHDWFSVDGDLHEYHNSMLYNAADAPAETNVPKPVAQNMMPPAGSYTV